LKAQYRQIKLEVDAAVSRAIESTQFVLWPEVAFEKRFARYCSASDCLAVNSGTSALHLADFPVTEKLADQFLSLQIYPELRRQHMAEVVTQLQNVEVVEAA
jgi:dTDP-4-amino-4,6-dideoxygalactose transaminase